MKRSKPEPPQKRIIATVEKTFPFDNYLYQLRDGAPLADFLNWVKNTLPDGTSDLRIMVNEDWCYDDCTTSLAISWREEIDNPHYDKEMKKFEKAIKKWEKENK